MTLKEYIDSQPQLTRIDSAFAAYDETQWQLYEALDSIGFTVTMGYKDRTLLANWLAQIGSPLEEVKAQIARAIKAAKSATAHN